MTYSAIEKLAVAGVQQLVPYKAGKPIEELERELGLRSIIKLASNEELLAILASVENRQALARDTGKERKVSSGPKVAKAPKEDLEVDI